MREWTVQEDLILMELLKDGLEAACRELGRPPEAVNIRIQFLDDHEIVPGPDGEVTHQRLCTSSALANNPKPKTYESGEGKKLMEQTLGK